MTDIEILSKILDNFNEACSRLGVRSMSEDEWTSGYEIIRAETIKAIKDNAHNIKPQESTDD